MHLIMKYVFHYFPFFEDGNYRQRERRQFPVVELLIYCLLMSRIFNHAKEGGKNTALYVHSALILLLLLLLSCLCLIKGHSVSWPH